MMLTSTAKITVALSNASDFERSLTTISTTLSFDSTTATATTTAATTTILTTTTTTATTTGQTAMPLLLISLVRLVIQLQYPSPPRLYGNTAGIASPILLLVGYQKPCRVPPGITSPKTGELNDWHLGSLWWYYLCCQFSGHMAVQVRREKPSLQEVAMQSAECHPDGFR